MKGEKKTAEIVKTQETYLPSTPVKFLEIYSPIKLRRTLSNVRTVQQALEVKTPSIATMIRKYGVEKVEPYIKVWLINLNETLNLKRPLKEHQIDECAYLIVDGYKNITVADINIIFKKAKTGEYGELFESLSVDKILRWFAEYFDVRCDVAGEMSRREAEKHKYHAEKSPRTSTAKDEEFHKVKLEHLSNQLKKQGNEEAKEK